MHFVRAAVAQLPAAAVCRVLATAGIPEDLLAAPAARVPAAAFAALWLAVARELDDEFFGLDRRRMKVGSFALLCHAVLPSGTLDRALRQMLRGFALFVDEVSAELRVGGAQATVTITNRIADAERRRFADETFLVMVHGLMCWLAGRRIPLTQAAFAHPRPAHAPEYAVMYCEHLLFDAPATGIRFDARWLEAPIVQTPASLKEFLRNAPQSIFLKYKNEDGWTARLRRRLRAGMDGEPWPVFEALAHEFHVAPTTLRRRLDSEGSSYQALKDELRRDAAIHHLCHSPMSVADIGALLGFADSSTFHRAFKKWSGVQPGEYRRTRAAGAVEPARAVIKAGARTCSRT